MRVSLVLLFAMVLTTASALSGYERGSKIPHVSIHDNSVPLQVSLFPDYYRNRSGIRDMRWVRQNDSAMVEFWEESGTYTLKTLAQLSGIPWVETDFNIYLVRHYPTAGSSEPLIIPVGGIRRGALVEAAPTGATMKLNLVYLLAHRNLAQITPPQDPLNRVVAHHPLMQPGPYRRDNLAMLLALVTCQQVMGLDSTYEALESPFWKQRTPGRRILEDYLLGEWILSSNRSIARWIAEEPHASKLVAITRTPQRSRRTNRDQTRVYVESLPLKGTLGFSVRRNELNLLLVDKIDVFRLAYACGLREGDIIRAVNGVRARTHKDLIEKIMAATDGGGATLQVVRENQVETVVIQTLDLPGIDDPSYWDYLEDSLLIEEETPADSLIHPEPDSSE